MPIIKWEPLWNPIDEMEKMVAFPTDKTQGFSPAIDVYQDKDNVYVESPLAGIDPKDVQITVENDVLTIKGESQRESEVEEKNFYRKEIRAGSFYRSVALPAHVIAAKAEANSKDGLLKITVPKAIGSKPKTIKIKARK